MAARPTAARGVTWTGRAAEDGSCLSSAGSLLAAPLARTARASRFGVASIPTNSSSPSLESGFGVVLTFGHCSSSIPASVGLASAMPASSVPTRSPGASTLSRRMPASISRRIGTMAWAVLCEMPSRCRSAGSLSCPTGSHRLLLHRDRTMPVPYPLRLYRTVTRVGHQAAEAARNRVRPRMASNRASVEPGSGL